MSGNKIIDPTINVTKRGSIASAQEALSAVAICDVTINGYIKSAYEARGEDEIYRVYMDAYSEYIRLREAGFSPLPEFGEVFLDKIHQTA